MKSANWNCFHSEWEQKKTRDCSLAHANGNEYANRANEHRVNAEKPWIFSLGWITMVNGVVGSRLSYLAQIWTRRSLIFFSVLVCFAPIISFDAQWIHMRTRRGFIQVSAVAVIFFSFHNQNESSNNLAKKLDVAFQFILARFCFFFLSMTRSESRQQCQPMMSQRRLRLMNSKKKLFRWLIIIASVTKPQSPLWHFAVKSIANSWTNNFFSSLSRTRIVTDS